MRCLLIEQVKANVIKNYHMKLDNKCERIKKFWFFKRLRLIWATMSHNWIVVSNSVAIPT